MTGDRFQAVEALERAVARGARAAPAWQVRGEDVVLRARTAHGTLELVPLEGGRVRARLDATLDDAALPAWLERLRPDAVERRPAMAS